MNKTKNNYLPPLLSNLAKAAEKQQNSRQAELYGMLSEETTGGEAVEADYKILRDMIAEDLSEYYPALQKSVEGRCFA